MTIKMKWYADPEKLKQHWRSGTLTYLMALSVIALLYVSSHYLTQNIIDEQGATARIVNLAGRQRMLSQRITRFAGELLLPAERQSTPNLLREYTNAVLSMAEVHRALLNGSARLKIPQSKSATIDQIFHQPPISLDEQVTRFIKTAELISAHNISPAEQQQALVQLRAAANKNILSGLDTLVHQYQIESEQAIQSLQNYNRLSLIGMFITLLLEALFVFRPLLLNLYRREQQYQKLVHDMEEEISERIHFLAFYDPLTELPNRISLLSRITAALHQSEAEKKHLALISVGLDRFKDINNSFGHDQGDDLLIKIAQRLGTLLKEYNCTVARIGGDEFILLLDNITTKLELMRVLRLLNSSINQPYELYDCSIQLSASLGIALYPEDGSEPGELLLHANQAMRSAKNEGGNCFRFFQAAMTTRMSRRMKVEHELRLAINNNQLSLFYQPQIDLRSQRIIGVEALIRWQHPQDGMLSPDEFIPIAEESGLIVELGDWVLVNALKQAAEWHRQNILIDVAINISVKQLLRRNIYDRLTALTRQLAIDPRYIQLEITENNIS
ncbi:putative bifunctional diguanylate cyclase/phosphodiesterase [Tolumonas lignilytica]|uniref:putative bifunctional diguanylate cyclase/phosphodiesterase n=1 Tax=Tolumonas lignilytica TaxID=1283284 RepID=UPI0004BA3E1B|nr:diguanylate cyclase [Tolumonas lignilytica]